MFEDGVRKLIGNVKKEHGRRFSEKCKLYMMAYNTYGNNEDPLTYYMVKRFLRWLNAIRTSLLRIKPSMKRLGREPR